MRGKFKRQHIIKCIAIILIFFIITYISFDLFSFSSNITYAATTRIQY